MWQSFIKGLNDLHSNWFGLVILCLGVFMAVHGRTDIAIPLISGSFAIINPTSNKEVPNNK